MPCASASTAPISPAGTGATTSTAAPATRTSTSACRSGATPRELHRADAPEVSWDLDVDVVTKDGELDFRGPCVQGKRGDRFVYLTWGTVADDGFTMFRRAKLMLGAVAPATLRAADTAGHRLVGTLGLTGGDGGPRCAAVRPPAIEWAAEPA